MSHIIVCGLGQVGFRVASLLLRLGDTVTVVTMGSREEFHEVIKEMGGLIVEGDARADKHLIAAGIDRARAVIACVDNDLTNIEIALDVRRLNPDAKVVARLFDQNLGRRLEESLGIHRAVAMSAAASPAFANAAFSESIRAAFLTPQGRFVVFSLGAGEPVPDGAQLLEGDDRAARYLIPQQKMAGPVRKKPRRGGLRQALLMLRIMWRSTPKLLRRITLVLIALVILSIFIFEIGLGLSPIDAIYFVVTTLTTTGYGDFSLKDASVAMKLYGCFLMIVGSASIATLYSIITDFMVTVRFDQLLGRHRTTSAEHVIVVGLGSVGFRTVLALQEFGSQVVAIDVNPNSEYRGLLKAETPFVGGDARDAETLELAGIERATAILAVTGDDAINLSVTLAAKGMNPNIRTVLRCFDAGLASKIQNSLHIDAAMSASRLSAPTFVGHLLYDDVVHCYVASNKFVVLRMPDGVPQVTEFPLKGTEPI